MLGASCPGGGMEASLRGWMAWAWQLGSAQPLLLVLSHRVRDPGAGRQCSESCLSVHLPVIVKGVQAQPGPAGDPSPPRARSTGAAAFPGLFAQAPQTSCPNRALAAHHPAGGHFSAAFPKPPFSRALMSGRGHPLEGSSPPGWIVLGPPISCDQRRLESPEAQGLFYNTTFLQ